jgi:cobalt/nickel transport system permease protein
LAHIPDGFLSGTVMVGTAIASGAALAVAARRSRRDLAEREAPILGAATAFVFASQMLNFPVGAGTSVHLLGGVLVGAIVGPWSGMLVLFAVLLVQALLFQDGGIASLGANTLNLSIISVGGGVLLYRWFLALVGVGDRRRVGAVAVAAFLSTVLVGVAVAAELAASGTIPIKPALVVVGGGHLFVGLIEAVLTGAILATVLRVRPELVTLSAGARPVSRPLAFGVAGVAALLAMAAGYVASTRPDVLEAAASRLGFTQRETAVLATPFGDYGAPAGGPWAAGLIGVVVVFRVGWVVVRLLARGRLRA